jgi:hypothetical protein
VKSKGGRMLGWKKKRGKRRWVVGREAQCFPPMAACTGKKSGRKGWRRENGVF